MHLETQPTYRLMLNSSCTVGLLFFHRVYAILTIVLLQAVRWEWKTVSQKITWGDNNLFLPYRITAPWCQIQVKKTSISRRQKTDGISMRWEMRVITAQLSLTQIRKTVIKMGWVTCATLMQTTMVSSQAKSLCLLKDFDCKCILFIRYFEWERQLSHDSKCQSGRFWRGRSWGRLRQLPSTSELGSGSHLPIVA